METMTATPATDLHRNQRTLINKAIDELTQPEASAIQTAMLRLAEALEMTA